MLAELKAQAREIAHHYERPGLAKLVDDIDEPHALRTSIVSACGGSHFNQPRLRDHSYAAAAFGVLLGLVRQ